MSDLEIEGPMGCTKALLPELVALANGIFRPEGDQDIFTDYPLVYRDENLENLRLIRVNGEVVAEVPFLARPVDHEGCRFQIGIISPTATHVEHRHNGYGLRCLNSCVERMKQQNIHLSVLWTIVPTFKFYNHSAFQAVRDQGYTYPCRRADASLFRDHGEQVLTFDSGSSEYLDDIQQMREARPFGIVRDQTQTAALFAIPGLTTRLALRDGRPAAYVCFSTSSNKPGIIEAACDAQAPEALDTLMHHVLAELPDDEPILAHTQLCRTALDDLLQTKAASRRDWSGEHFMVCLIDVPGFFRCIAPWLKRKNGDRRQSFSIGIKDADQTISFDFANGNLELGSDQRPQHFALSRVELTSTIFGAHPDQPFDAPEPLAQFFPFYFPISVLDRS